MVAHEMKYELKLSNDGSHDQGVSLNLPADLKLLAEFETNPEDKRFFQRSKIYRLSDNREFIVLEEVWGDYRILRFNYPFEKQGDSLVFNFD